MDAAAHIGEPRLGVCTIELGRGDEGVNASGALAAPVRAGEEPRLPADRDPAQRSLGRVVREADPAVAEEAAERRRALQHVVHGLRLLPNTRARMSAVAAVTALRSLHSS